MDLVIGIIALLFVAGIIYVLLPVLRKFVLWFTGVGDVIERQDRLIGLSSAILKELKSTAAPTSAAPLAPPQTPTPPRSAPARHPLAGR